ncbi:dynein axonemal heavy chain 3-like [Penaeus chinensis]|uniref:dynein axonemal heavy chain 3-like n=1 Tax=Penaeus chinensis TaxID=139456 RepID=UPI001FB6B9EA|nr:dynein axonemal heavy chain 3-like [Penaeus chinensis]
MVSARIETSRLSSKSSSSTSLSGAPRISAAGMKVIKQFHLQDLLKKQEQRAAVEAAKLRRSRGQRKVRAAWRWSIGITVTAATKRASPAVRYREASQLCGLEDQLHEQREARARRPLPSEHDLARYAHYLAHGIKTAQMTSPPANLLKVVTMDVDKSMLRNIRFRLVVSDLVEELQDCFYKGARSAILKYALRCPTVRARLGIGVPPLSHEPLVVRAPVPWHQSFLTGAHHCYHNLFALNHILNNLDTIWEERFGSLRFIDMPSLAGKADLLAPTPEALEEAVRSQCAETRRILLQKWLPAVARVFGDLVYEWRSLVPTDVADSLRQVRRFFSAVRSRMSLQLRRLVLDSICDLRDALVTHKAGNDYSGEYQEKDFIERAVVEVAVTVRGKKVIFQPPLPDTRDHILNCLKAIIEHNEKIPRVEKLLFPEMGRRRLYLHAVSPDEEAVAKVKGEVSDLFSVNAQGPVTYVALYDRYTHLLDGTTLTEVQEFIDTCGILKEGKKQLSTLQGLGEEVRQLKDRVPLGLLVLNCHDVNLRLKQQVDMCSFASAQVFELTTAIQDYFVARNKEHDKE